MSPYEPNKLVQAANRNLIDALIEWAEGLEIETKEIEKMPDPETAQQLQDLMYEIKKSGYNQALTDFVTFLRSERDKIEQWPS